MKDGPQRLVFAGYDEVADAYLDRFGVSKVRQRWLERLVASLPATGGHVLDLGCGAGVPVARDLVALGHSVIGIDGSPRQVARARRNVPGAAFIEADMGEVTFAARSFDAVGAFYSITHLPPASQDRLIAKIAMWLKPGGTFIASFGAGVASEWTGNWLGTEMFFGHAGESETMKSLTAARLLVRYGNVEKQDDEDTSFLWVEALKGR